MPKMIKIIVNRMLICFVFNIMSFISGVNGEESLVIKLTPQELGNDIFGRSGKECFKVTNRGRWSCSNRDSQNLKFIEQRPRETRISLSDSGFLEDLMLEKADRNGKRIRRKSFYDQTGRFGNEDGGMSRYRKHNQDRIYNGKKKSGSDYLSQRFFSIPNEDGLKYLKRNPSASKRLYHSPGRAQELQQQQQPDNNIHSLSVNMFKLMKTSLDKLQVPGEFRKLGRIVNSHTSGEVITGPKWRYKCTLGVKSSLGVENGRSAGSRGLVYSEDDGKGVKTLFCKAETSEIYRPDEETFVKNSVSGVNVVTTDYDPFKFLSRGNDVDRDRLEIGSKAVSALETRSRRNQTLSSVDTQDREAQTHAKVATKFMYKDGKRTAFESVADVQGSTHFNIINKQNPLVFKSEQESSSIIKNLRQPSFGEKEDFTTLMNYNKKTDFDISFRNMFDYHRRKTR